MKSHGNLRMLSSWTLLKGLVNVQTPRSIDQPMGIWDIYALSFFPLKNIDFPTFHLEIHLVISS